MGDGWVSPGKHDQDTWDGAWPNDPPGFHVIKKSEAASGDVTGEHEWITTVVWTDVAKTRAASATPIREECERCGSHVHRVIDDKGANVAPKPPAPLHHVADNHFGDHSGKLWPQTLFRGREIKRIESRLAHRDGTLYGFATVQWLEKVINHRADEVEWDDILSEYPCTRDGDLVAASDPARQSAAAASRPQPAGPSEGPSAAPTSCDVDLRDFVEITLDLYKDSGESGGLTLLHVREDHTIDGALNRLPLLAGTWADGGFPDACPTVRFATQTDNPEFTVRTTYQAEAYNRRTANAPGQFDFYLLIGTYDSVVWSEGERFERSGHWWAHALIPF